MKQRSKRTNLLVECYIHFLLQRVDTYEFVPLCTCTFLLAESSQWILLLVDVTTVYHCVVSENSLNQLLPVASLTTENGFDFVFWLTNCDCLRRVRVRVYLTTQCRKRSVIFLGAAKSPFPCHILSLLLLTMS